ncbi:transglycosylase SLT domain-containing protein [Acinetobacter thermotolerans]|uniref:lytic transglycosylase domain-containing protein n=1 Tax=Acinetobacter thermotolerans TaxID=3151487 RepID=UPI00325A9D2F
MNKTIFKLGIVSLSTVLVSACSSFGGSSLEKRSVKLAQGIQTAYAVPATTAQRISPLIIQNADKHNLDPLLVAAVIRQESTYRSQVSSPAGAVGLMQVVPRYWQSTCGNDLYNDAVNIGCGSYILSRYHQSSGSLEKALGYYNVGPNAYENNRKMRKQGKKYAKQVLSHKKKLKSSL